MCKILMMVLIESYLLSLSLVEPAIIISLLINQVWACGGALITVHHPGSFLSTSMHTQPAGGVAQIKRRAKMKKKPDPHLSHTSEKMSHLVAVNFLCALRWILQILCRTRVSLCVQIRSPHVFYISRAVLLRAHMRLHVAAPWAPNGSRGGFFSQICCAAVAQCSGSLVLHIYLFFLFYLYL